MNYYFRLRYVNRLFRRALFWGACFARPVRALPPALRERSGLSMAFDFASLTGKRIY